MSISPLQIPMRETEKPRIRIRGIYSTALTKLFLDNDFEIIQPSLEIAERFSLNPERYLSPQIDVFDRSDKQGVIAESLCTLTEQFISILFDILPDVVVRKSRVQKGAIYKGIVYRPAPKGGYLVKITPQMDAWLPIENTKNQEIKLGDPIIVEIKDIDETLGIPKVSMQISIPGDFAVLISEESVRVSHKIKGSVRDKLIELGKILRPEDWGIIWRTGAANADVAELQEEIEVLAKEAEKLMQLSKNAPALIKLRNGFDVLNIQFPARSKIKLDGIRAQVFPTVSHHHWLKSYANNLTRIIDFAEKYLAKSVSMETLNTAINEMLKKEFLPQEGKLLKIYHIKPNGREVILGPAKVIMIKEDNGFEYRMFRRFVPGGYYDGIGAPKEAGDYGVTIVRVLDDKLITAYFSVDNKLKGIYINLNTPIEVYPDGFRYIDLEIDVVLAKDNQIRILDTQRLDRYVEEGIISKNLAEETRKRAEELKEWLSGDGVDEILNICDEVRSKLEEMYSLEGKDELGFADILG